MNRGATRFCRFRGCREPVGQGYVCRAHWLDLPLLLQRALTGSRGAERAMAERQVDEWIKNRQPVPPANPPAKPFHETEE